MPRPALSLPLPAARLHEQATLQGTRELRLRVTVPRDRLAVTWRGPADELALRAALDELRRRIRTPFGLPHA